jgi:hypothetical protein
METAPNIIKLSTKEEAVLSYNLEQDPDQWLVLLDQQFLGGELPQSFNMGIIEDSESWQEVVDEAKTRGFGQLKDMALDKSVQWNIRFRKLLANPLQVIILRFYLKTMIALKLKKVADFGGRAATKQKINNILSFVANEAHACLDRYWDAFTCLQTGKTVNGTLLNQDLKIFYEGRMGDFVKRTATLVAIIVVFKGANSLDDTHKLQSFIDLNMIIPTESLLKASKEKYEQQQLKDRLEVYRKLRSAVEITFE